MVAKTKAIYRIEVPITGLAKHSYVSYGGPFASTANGDTVPWIRDYIYRSWNTTVGWKTARKTRSLKTLAFSESHEIRKLQNAAEFRFKDWHPSFPNNKEYNVISNFAWNLSLVPSIPHFYSGVEDVVEVEAKSRALDKARDMKTNLAVMLGEGRQSVAMIADRARKLGEAYQAFRRGNLRRVAELLGKYDPGAARRFRIRPPNARNLANNWLEWKYGWFPLVQDLKGLAETAAQNLELGGRASRIKVFGTKTRATSASQHLDGNFSNIRKPSTAVDYWLRGNYYQSAGTIQGTAWLDLEMDFRPAALAAQMGFGIVDLASLAWELTPFSFVFDWFIDVGSWLQDAGSLQGWTVKDAGTSKLQEFPYTISWNRLVSNHGMSQIDSDLPGPLVGSLRYYSRSPWSPSGNKLKAPIFDALGAQRITTAVALFYQRGGHFYR